MKYATGFIFMFTLCCLSMYSSLRELEFIESLYPVEGIPSPLFTAIVKRRMDQIKFYGNATNFDESLFMLSTANQSLSLLVDSLKSNGPIEYNRRNDAYGYISRIDFYVEIVQTLNSIFVDHLIDNADNLEFNLNSTTTKYSLNGNAALIGAVIDDIQLVIDYEQSENYNAKGIDTTIVDKLNELSNEFHKFMEGVISKEHIDEYQSMSLIEERSMYLFMARLNFLVKSFKNNLLHHSK